MVCFHEYIYNMLKPFICHENTTVSRPSADCVHLYLQLQKFVKADGNVDMWLVALYTCTYSSRSL